MKLFHYYFTVALAAIAMPSGHGADWYLDAAASGGNDGTSWTDAWQTTADVVWASVADGDTLWIQGGAYDDLSIPSAATVTNATVRIATNATEAAVFDGASAISDFDGSLMDGLLGTNYMFKFRGQTNALPALTTSTAITLKWSQGTTFRGIEIDRSHLFDDDEYRFTGFNMQNSSSPANDEIIIEDCYFHHTTADALNIGTPGPGAGFEQYIIRRTSIVHIGDDAIQCSGNITINDCFFDVDGVDALFGGHQDGIQTGIGAEYIRIYNNRITGFSQCIFVEEAAGHVEVYNNILYDDGSTSGTNRGLVAGVQDTNSYNGSFTVANNTVYGFLTFYGAQHNSANNLRLNGGDVFVGNYIFVNCKLIVSGEGIVTSTNIYYDLPGVQYYDSGGSPVATPSAGTRGEGSATNDDPLLVDPANADFKLQAGSPAIGAGTDYSAYFTTDIEGSTRTTWDIGAYKYTPFDGTPVNRALFPGMRRSRRR